MANRESPEKRAMDAKLAEVWSDRHQDSATVRLHSYPLTLSHDRVRALRPQQEEAVERVFRPLRAG